MKRLVCVAAFFLCTSAVGASAAAGGPTVATKKEQSDRVFGEGVQAFNAKDWKKAREKFAEAYALFPGPSSLFNLALAEEEGGALVDAIGHYRTYIGLPDTAAVAKGRAEARAKLAACQAKICRLDVRAPVGTAVRVNGKDAALQGSIVETLPGEQMVDLAHDGVSKTRRSACGAGETVVVEFNDPPTTVVIPAPTASTTASVPPGPPPATETFRPTAGYVVPIVLFGTGAAGLALGAVFGASSSSAADDAEKRLAEGACTNAASASCGSARDAASSAGSRHTLSTAMWIAGGVLAAGGVVSFLLWPKSTRELRALRVQPTVGGLFLSGSF